jgi:hypothetical protein
MAARFLFSPRQSPIYNDTVNPFGQSKTQAAIACASREFRCGFVYGKFIPFCAPMRVASAQNLPTFPKGILFPLFAYLWHIHLHPGFTSARVGLFGSIGGRQPHVGHAI